METLFLQVLNMSFVGGVVILLILFSRIFLKKVPKIFSYSLWVVALFRLIFPFSFESNFSIIPVNSIPLSNEILNTSTSQVNPGMTTVDYYINPSLPVGNMPESINAMQLWPTIGAILWITGTSVLLLYGIISYIRLKRKLDKATHENENIYRSNAFDTPFVLGIIRPKIYLPVSLSESEREYIILHEQSHINRFDHIARVVSYLVLCVHWFNPLVWVAFFASGKDMEMSCDESVISRLGDGIKKEYSTSLLTFASGSKRLGVTPLAFGEVGTKGRIKNVMNYKKPMFWVMILALIGILVLSFSLLTNPKQKEFTVEEYAEQYVQNVIDEYENAEYQDLKIIDHNITSLNKIAEFDRLMNYPIELWALEYRLKPDNIENVIFAGGMNQIDGWITEDSSMGKPIMIFSYEKEQPNYLGIIWTGEMGNALTTREIELRKFLEFSGNLPAESFAGEHHIVKFKLSTGETAQALLSQPATQGGGGIWCVERWMDGNGNVYFNDPQAEKMLTEYYTELQNQSDDGHKPWLLNPAEVALDFINNTLGQSAERGNIELVNNVTKEDFLQTPISRYVGYISNFAESYPDMFHFDPIEWITLDDTKRIEDLQIRSEEMTNGYYIYNPREDIFSFNVNEKTKYQIINWGENFVGQDEGSIFYTTKNKDELIRYLKTYSDNSVKVPFLIETKDGYVIRISEQYVP